MERNGKREVGYTRRNFFGFLAGLAASGLSISEAKSKEVEVDVDRYDAGTGHDYYDLDQADLKENVKKQFDPEVIQFAEDFYKEGERFFNLVSRCKNDEPGQFKELLIDDTKRSGRIDALLTYLERNIAEALRAIDSSYFPSFPFHFIDDYSVDSIKKLNPTQKKENRKEWLVKGYQRLYSAARNDKTHKDYIETVKSMKGVDPEKINDIYNSAEVAIRKFFDISKELNNEFELFENKESPQYIRLLDRYSEIALGNPTSKMRDYCAS